RPRSDPKRRKCIRRRPSVREVGFGARVRTSGGGMARKPEEVFTPKTIASREMFERRNEADLDGNPGLQDNLQDALREAGGQVVLYGDTGVGKSSLLRYAAEDEGMEIVPVECLSSKSYEDLIEDAIRK